MRRGTQILRLLDWVAGLSGSPYVPPRTPESPPPTLTDALSSRSKPGHKVRVSGEIPERIPRPPYEDQFLAEWAHRFQPRQREPTERPQANYLVETSAMKRRSIEMTRDVGKPRIRSRIAFLSVCILVGLVAFFAAAHAQVATPNQAATATPAPTATPFPRFVPGGTPRP